MIGTCVITGATSGIGRAMATALVPQVARLAVVARNPTKADDLAAALRTQAPDVDVGVVLADLASLEEVRRAGQALRDRYERIDVLVNNAGIHTTEASATADGFDPMIATNYLGPFLLTNLVLDRLEAAAPSRIVVTASEAHRLHDRIDVERLAEPQRGGGVVAAQRAYGTSKLLDILFTQELARRLEGSGVTANCFCPGLVATDLARENPMLTQLSKVASTTPFVRRPEQGAAMGVRLATDPDLANVSGRFFSSTPGAGLLPTQPIRRDRELQRRLWDRTAELVGL